MRFCLLIFLFCVHSSIDNRNGKLTLIPENTEFETFVNGEMVYDKIQLFHGDRLVIGGSHYFRISNPDCPNRSKNMVSNLTGCDLDVK